MSSHLNETPSTSTLLRLRSLPLCRLVKCGVTQGGCASLASALRSNPTHLRALNLSLNELQRSGPSLLSSLQTDPLWSLETLEF
ncbi:hypothetical protein COCON_G00206790 [Conger conger]|uniref:Uncharacterized protein n=1 Tax=Conger conger TaxID=82655 RepID=A0A9Q1D0G5_CONCO|nr:hypothetical protein COCON_G00206790 [Conger conger]